MSTEYYYDMIRTLIQKIVVLIVRMLNMFIIKNTKTNVYLNHTLSDTWQYCYSILIDNDPQLSYLHREEMEDIVHGRFVEMGGWLKVVEVNLEEVCDEN